MGPCTVSLVCPRASFRALWVPLASLGGRLGVPLGYLWGLFGRFGVTWAARGCPKMLKTRKHAYLWGLFGRFGVTWVARGCPGVPKDVENQKTHVFTCFCQCVKKHVFLCVSRSGQGSMHQNTCVFVCFRIFEAEVAPKQNIRIFVFEARFSENTRFCGFLCLGHF